MLDVFRKLSRAKSVFTSEKSILSAQFFSIMDIEICKIPDIVNHYIDRRDRKRHPCVRISLMNDTMHSNVIMGMQLMESTILKRISNDKRTERR